MATRDSTPAAPDRQRTVGRVSPFRPPVRDEANLTPRQRRILEVIQAAVEKHGYPPTVREICDAVGLSSPSSGAHQLKTLESRGFLRRDPKRPRALEVCLPGPSTSAKPVASASQTADFSAAKPVSVPLVGRIAAGAPLLATEEVEDVFPLPEQLIGHGTFFMLTVQGDSMTDAAIRNGDFVVVRSQPTAEEGEIVAALLDGEATVKTLRRRGDEVWLLPQNPAYDPIDGRDAVILGKVVAVLRRL
ncbi:MAG: transcriptional repressor LexA [Propionibacteriaceae bacterium]|jgi:repressor LexA|nr:transcriptional repressor LexA [Propionibacteriaceae bacterium]